MTKYGDAKLSDYQVHQISDLENGFYYYEMIHAKGFRIVMRESENQKAYLYAVGTYANRVSLSYNTYDKLT